MSEFDILRSASAGMDAQRAALDLAARNVAASQATPDGHAFERLVPRFAVGSAPEREASDAMPLGTGDDLAIGDGSDLSLADETGGLIDGAGAAGGASDPDAAGLPIRYLGASTQRGGAVDTVAEMVSVLDAQRAYEANASVFDLGKRLAERTIDMGRLS